MFLGLDLGTIILALLGYFLGAGGLIFWFLERKKFNAEVRTILNEADSTRIKNDLELYKYQKEYIDDLEQGYEKRLQNFIKVADEKEMLYTKRYETFEKTMSSKIQILKSENALLRKKVEVLKDEIKDLEKKIAEKDGIIKLLQAKSTKS